MGNAAFFFMCGGAARIGGADRIGERDGGEARRRTGAEPHPLAAGAALVMHVKCIHELCTLIAYIPIIFASYEGYINVL